MLRLLTLISIACLPMAAVGQTLEEQFQERIVPVYTSATEEEKLAAAKEVYAWAEGEEGLQTYVVYFTLNLIFTQQAPDEVLAAATKEKSDRYYQDLLAGYSVGATQSTTATDEEAVVAVGGYDPVWIDEYYTKLFFTRDVKVPRRAARYLKDHPELQTYENYTYVAYSYQLAGDLEEAWRMFSKARELEGDPTKLLRTQLYYANFLVQSGRLSEAREQLARMKRLSETAELDYMRTSYLTEWMGAQSQYFGYTGDWFQLMKVKEEELRYYEELGSMDYLVCDPYTQTRAVINAQGHEALGDLAAAARYWRVADSAALAYQECAARTPNYTAYPVLRISPLFEVKRGERPADATHNAAEIEAVHTFYTTPEFTAGLGNRYLYINHLAMLGAEDYPARYREVLRNLDGEGDFSQSTLPWSQYAYLRTRDGDWDDAWDTYQELFSMNVRWINDLIFSFGEQAFVAYYNTRLKDGYDSFHTLVRLAQEGDEGLYDKMVGQGVDNLLLVKALAFKGARQRKASFLRSQDESVQALYQEWLLKKQALIGIYQQMQLAQQATTVDTATQVVSTEELRVMQDVVDRLEDRLATEAEGFADQLQVATPRWQEIQRRLEPGEAAIEWVRFPWRHHAYYSDSAFYGAYIIRPEWKHPQLVVLPTLASALETDYYGAYSNSMRFRVGDYSSYGAFWEPLAGSLDGIRKVYIANDGVMHLINLHTLYNPTTDRYLGEDVEIQYLTSTADLLEEKPARLLRRAILLGRPAYTVSSDVPAEPDTTRERSFVGSFGSFEIADLPGTEDEVSAIQHSLEEHGVEVTLYLGEEAREEVLYEASRPGILHIATHGYWNQLEYKATEGYRAFNAMVNSGLLLSGVVNFYQASEPAYTHDGVLTAYEAQGLDLEGTDLVVLSACETGLGLFDAGEGVYGLQRAFRAAGAQSTLTSLWKVDDRATQEFMTAFYGYYLAGKTKAEAYRQAQADLRAQYGDPFYWGAFVLTGE